MAIRLPFPLMDFQIFEIRFLRPKLTQNGTTMKGKNWENLIWGVWGQPYGDQRPPRAPKKPPEASKWLPRHPQSSKNGLQNLKNEAQYTTKARKMRHDPPPRLQHCHPHDLQSGTAQQTSRTTRPYGHIKRPGGMREAVESAAARRGSRAC